MSDENFEDWDTDFLEEAIKVEEEHLSSQYPLPLLPTPTTSSYLPQPSLNLAALPRKDFSSYSPPRELSQRTTLDYGNVILSRPVNDVVPKCVPPSVRVRHSDNAKDLEIERLKKELGQVSKQLTELKHECFELKKGRDKESVVHSGNEGQEANLLNSKREICLPGTSQYEARQEYKNARASDDTSCSRMHLAKSSKATGVQADLSAHLDFSKKLQGVWGLRDDQNIGTSLLSKLFVACPSDFHVLFGCMGLDTSFIVMDSKAPKSTCEVTLKYDKNTFPASEAAKVSHLYSVMMKIGNGTSQLEALFGPLLELCSVKNVAIVHRSLRILNALLKYLLAMERKSEKRDSIIVEGLDSRTDMGHHFEPETAFTGGNIFVNSKEASSTGHMPLQLNCNAQTSYRKGHWITSNVETLSSINWVSLFEFMRQLVMGITEEHVRVEAISIMNVILMRTNAFVEREKFALPTLFESITQLLRKEASLDVRKEAVRLLYLVLNCPKVLVTFCSGCKDGESPGAVNNNCENEAFKQFNGIFQGLANCIASCGNGLQDLELCRNVITVLAFIASSGNASFEILSSNKLQAESNFLMLILQLLVSEIDAESTLQNESAENFKTRTLLMREALILLNRLVSNASCSVTILRVLTNNRDMVSLTVDVANRLSRKVQKLQQFDNVSRHMRESEIVDLARIFKKRVFTYLGDNLS